MRSMRWGIARFSAQKRPPAAQLPHSATEELHEFGSAARAAPGGLCQPPQGVTRTVDLGFPEFSRHVLTLKSELAATILSRYPHRSERVLNLFGIRSTEVVVYE